MRRTRKGCCKILLCTFCMVCIFHILLTVEVNLSTRQEEFMHLSLKNFNNTDLWNSLLYGRSKNNLTLPSSLTHFEKFYNKKNKIDPKVVTSGKTKQNQGWFNTSYLGIMQKRLVATGNLSLPLALADFQKLYNTHAHNHSVLQYGHTKKSPGYLTIGIPTVKRRHGADQYLFTTILSLLSNIDSENRDQIVIVIFMADPDDSWNDKISQKVYTEFKSHFDNGLIQIIKAPPNVYPDFTKLDKTKHDSVERVRWRSKQNVDFAFLMLYCQNLSQYYIQLEDDVLSAPNFVKDIEKFVQNQTRRWVCLEFSTLGFIGKMFHSSDLRMISSVLLTYFKDTPCDLLLGRIIRFLGQSSPIHSPFSLFQHIGKISSLRNKLMPSIDRLFKGIGSNVLPIMKMPKGDHPAAKFTTNMQTIPGYPPENVYKNNSYFWASYPKGKQYFRIIFDNPLTLSRVVISTGENINKTDFLENGILKVGVSNNQNNICTKDLKQIGVFVEGEFDSLIQGIALPNNIKCLQIEAKKSQKHWLIIRDIEVFTNKLFIT